MTLVLETRDVAAYAGRDPGRSRQDRHGRLAEIVVQVLRLERRGAAEQEACRQGELDAAADRVADLRFATLAEELRRP